MSMTMKVIAAIGGAFLAGLLIWDRAAPLDWPTVSQAACPTFLPDAAALSRLAFEGAGRSLRHTTNGTRVRQAEGQTGLSCRVVVSRADCQVRGPTQVQALSAGRAVFFDIPAGQSAELRAHRGRFLCGLRAPHGAG
jgi:hypothetical protein